MSRKEIINKLEKDLAALGGKLNPLIDDPRRFIITYQHRFNPIWYIRDFDSLPELKSYLSDQRLTIGASYIIMDLDINREIKCNWIPSLEYIR